MKYLRGFFYGLSTLAVYLGVTLVGWGVDDFSGFLHLGPRAGYALLATGFALAVGWQAVEAPQGIDGSPGEAGKRIPRQTIVGLALSLLLFCALAALPWADRRQVAVWPENTLLRWLGLGAAALGYGLIFSSGLALGRMYSADVTLQKDHQLITGGVYRHIRHPRYLGLLFGGFGLACLFRSWIGLGLLAVLLAMILMRIRDEEALLQEAFGAAWRAYCQRSWRLIPYVY